MNGDSREEQHHESALVQAILYERAMLPSSSKWKEPDIEFFESGRSKKTLIKTGITIRAALNTFLPIKKCISKRRLNSLRRFKYQRTTFGIQNACIQCRKSKILKKLRNELCVNNSEFSNTKKLYNFAAHYSDKKMEIIRRPLLFDQLHKINTAFFAQCTKAWKICHEYLEYIIKEMNQSMAEIIHIYNPFLDGAICSINGVFGFITRDKDDSLEVAFPCISRRLQHEYTQYLFDAKYEHHSQCTVYYKTFSKSISQNIILLLPRMEDDNCTEIPNPFYHEVKLGESEVVHIRTLSGVWTNVIRLRRTSKV